MEKGFYYTIPKGRGYMYVSGNNLYRQVKKRGTRIYVKCYYEHCDGSVC